MERIILASQSPRRRELLGKLGVEFDVVPSNYDEQLDDSRDIEEVAIELGLGKAEDVAKKYPDAYVIGSDTIVGIDGRQLAKAADTEEARQMLLALAGRESVVTTSIVLLNLNKGVRLTDADTAKIYFKPDNDEVTHLREEYLASGDWKDKAGAYGIQSGAGPLIDHIEGDYDSIVGLPTKKLAAMLNGLGIVTR